MTSRLIILLCILCTYGCQNRSQVAEEGGHRLVPEDWFFAQRAYPYGKIDRQAYYRAQASHKPFRHLESATRSSQHWEAVGPINIGGRITDMVMWPNDTQTILAGTASGGIFRSENQGASWTTVFDNAPSLAIGALAASPSHPDIVYAGTGEANAGGGSIAYDGLGMFKSTDQGRTWFPVGLAESGSIGALAVHPQSSDTVYAAAMGFLFANNPERGLYRSVDGGTSWKKVLYINDSTGVIDVVLHPTDPSIVYAASWERVRRPQRRSYSGPGSGIWKSEDGGQSWSKLRLPASDVSTNLGGIGLAVSPATPDHLLTYIVHPSGNLHAIYLSTDQGNSWQSITQQGIDQVSFMWWFGKIWMHPSIPEQYYLAGLNMHAFAPRAKRWSTIFPGTHVDQHALIVHPAQPGLMVAGNDGGVYISRDDGSTFEHVQQLPITQFYTTHIDRTGDNRFYGGTQDNGVIRTLTGTQQDWSTLFFADGFRTLVAPNDPNTIYLSYQYGNLLRSTSGGKNFFAATNGIPNTDRKNWHTPIVMDPLDSETLYFGTQRLYKSDNRAFSWNPISPDLTKGDPGGNLAFGTLTDISISTIDPNILYTGADDGSVWRTLDGGHTWTPIHKGLPNRWVTTILASPQRPEEVFVTLSGFRFGEHLAQVYRSTDYGDNWTPLIQGLPDVPVNDLIITRFQTLYLATDVGVFRSLNQGESWEPFQSGMPPVVVTDLDYNPENDVLLAATYGRSMFKTIIKDQLTSVPTLAFAKKPTIYPNPASNLVHVSWQPLNMGSGELTLHNLQGQIISQQKMKVVVPEKLQVEWALETLPSGFYTISWSENGTPQWVEPIMVN